MVRHIVIFKLKNFQDAKKAKEILLSMQGNVPMLKKLEVYVDELRSARSYDVMLVTEMDNFDVLEEYQNDPYHCGVVKKFMHEASATSVAMDFTL